MNTDIPIPGTVQLIDTAGILHVEHGAGHKEIVLVPQPTDDPNDPLRWGKSRKMTSLVTALAWCFFIGAMISGLSPAYILIEEDTGISVADLSTGNGLMYLMMGWGTLLTQRFALTYGRRLTLVGCAVLVTAMTIWTAFVKTRGEFFANRFLLGTFTSPQETLIEIVVGDLYFTHDRGFYLGLYAWSLFAGAFLCPVASGYVAQELGWQWIQYILTIVGAALAIGSYFFFEETMFQRDHEKFLVHAQQTGIATSTAADMTKTPEMMVSSDSEKNYITQERSASPVIEYSPPMSTGPTRTYTEKLKLWGYHNPSQKISFQMIIMPFQLLLKFPGMFFSGLLVGGILSWYNVVGGSQALIFGNAPYNFSANTIGLTYLASLIGVSIGCVISGHFSDKLAVFLSRRNHGIMEPEQRLWICLVALVLHPAGCLLYGVGASYHIHWFGVVFGLGLICVTLPMGSTLAYTYIMDSYREMQGDGMVAAILVRNTMGKFGFPQSSLHLLTLVGFAFGYAVVPMINNLGVRYTFIVIACLGEIVWSVGVVMIYVGKPLRRKTAQSYWDLVEKTGAHAH